MKIVSDYLDNSFDTPLRTLSVASPETVNGVEAFTASMHGFTNDAPRDIVTTIKRHHIDSAITMNLDELITLRSFIDSMLTAWNTDHQQASNLEFKCPVPQSRSRQRSLTSS